LPAWSSAARREQLQRGQALGSVESLASCRRRQRARVSAAVRTSRSWPSSWPAGRRPTAATRRWLRPRPHSWRKTSAAFKATNAALARLRRFVSTRDLSRLPARLSDGLASTLKQLERLDDVRTEAQRGATSLVNSTAYYTEPSRFYPRTAALSELTDDGEVAALDRCAVAVLEVEERASRRAALLGTCIGRRFPPGSFRDMVDADTEEQTFVEVSNERLDEPFSDYRRACTRAADRADQLRKKAMESADDDLEHRADEWSRRRARRSTASGSRRAAES